MKSYALTFFLETDSFTKISLSDKNYNVFHVAGLISYFDSLVVSRLKISE